MDKDRGIKYMIYQNYIFDLYGTLVDIHTDESKASLWKKIAVYFSAQGAAYTGKEIKERYIELIHEEEKRLHRKLKKKYPDITVREVEIDLDRVFVKLYKEKGIKANRQLVKDSMVAFRAITMEKLRLFPGAAELLTGLKSEGKRVYLLSNAQTSFTLPEMKALGIEAKIEPIRGGTDGARMSFMGVYCPNLGTGGHNFHGKHEFACVESMEKVVELLLKIAEADR